MIIEGGNIADWDKKGEALPHRSMGEVHNDISQFEESLRDKEMYLKMSTGLEDSAEEQRALYLLGQSYQRIAITDALEDRRKSFIKALDYYEKSFNAVKGIPARDLAKGEREVMRARCLRNLASINWHLGNKELFNKYFEKARDALSLDDGKRQFEDLHGLYDDAANLLLGGDYSDLKLADTYSKISVEKAQRVHGQNEKSCQYFSLVTRSKVQIVKEEFHLLRTPHYG